MGMKYTLKTEIEVHEIEKALWSMGLANSRT